MANDNNSNDGWFWLVLVIAVIGGGYLWQQEGGKLFGPGGIFGPRNEGPSPDKRLAFGTSEVYFVMGVDQGEAQKIGELLVREKYFEATIPATVLIRQKDRRYQVRCVVKKGSEITSKMTEYIEDLANMISREVVMDAPVDIHFCDRDWKTIRTFVFQAKPSKIEGLKAGWDTGTFTHDFLLTNGSASDLSEVEITLTLYREDGERVPFKKFWSSWNKNETKKVNVSAHRYQKMEVQGTAINNSRKVRIDSYWNQNWDYCQS